MSSIEALLGTPHRIEVERAIVEFRAGRPCLLVLDGAPPILAAPADGIEDPRLVALARLADGVAPELLLTGRRAHWLGLTAGEPAVVGLDLPTGADARFVADVVMAARERLAEITLPPVREAGLAGRAAVELARLAHLAPAAVLIRLAPGKAAELAAFMASVRASALLGYRQDVSSDLHIVSQARVPLRPDITTRFVVFRGGRHPHDQVAIVVGNPDPNATVPVRLHSACLTGDLFGSLKCDCGDQLRMTVERFAEIGGGVLLYLDQEGRGIGIANKMRAYKLQDEGFDTIDADAQLGFDDDERNYAEAANMLTMLGYRRVQLHSNNPRKAEALRRAGLDLVAREPVMTPVTRENARYLKTKARRAGHFIDTDWVDEAEAALALPARTAAE